MDKTVSAPGLTGSQFWLYFKTTLGSFEKFPAPGQCLVPKNQNLLATGPSISSFKTSPGDFNMQSHLRTSCMKTIQGIQVLPLNQYGRAWGQHSPHESSRRRQELSWPRCTVREPGLGLRVRSSQPLILLLIHQGGPSGLHAVWPWVAFHLVGHLALVLSKNLVNDGHCSLCSPGLSVFFLCEKPVEFFL